MYYGHEAGFLRIAEMRQKAAVERRAREIQEASHREDEALARPARHARRFWHRTA